MSLSAWHGFKPPTIYGSSNHVTIYYYYILVYWTAEDENRIQHFHEISGRKTIVLSVVLGETNNFSCTRQSSPSISLSSIRSENLFLVEVDGPKTSRLTLVLTETTSVLFASSSDSSSSSAATRFSAVEACGTNANSTIKMNNDEQHTKGLSVATRQRPTRTALNCAASHETLVWRARIRNVNWGLRQMLCDQQQKEKKTLHVNCHVHIRFTFVTCTMT